MVFYLSFKFIKAEWADHIFKYENGLLLPSIDMKRNFLYPLTLKFISYCAAVLNLMLHVGHMSHHYSDEISRSRTGYRTVWLWKFLRLFLFLPLSLLSQRKSLFEKLGLFLFFCFYTNKSYEIVHWSTIQKEKIVINLVDSSSPFIGRYNGSPISFQQWPI